MTTERELPEGWRILPFAEIAENINERVDDPSSSGLDHYVGLEHLDPDTLKISRWGSPTDVEATKLRFYPGDVIYARRRAYQRKLGVAEWDGIASAHSLVLRARPEVCLPGFLPYFLQSDQFHQRALEISVGSLSPTINWKTLAVQEFALPSVYEQLGLTNTLQGIDGVLDHYEDCLSAADSCRAALASALAGVDEAPLGELANVQYGLTVGPRRRDLSQTAPYLRVANVQRGALDLAEIKSVGADESDLVRFQLQEGDLLVVEGHADRNEVGRAAIWSSMGHPGPMLHQNHVIRVRCGDRVRPRVVLELLNSPTGRRYFSSHAKNTSGLNTVNSTTVKDFPVPLVEMQTQREMESRLTELDRLSNQASATHEQLRALRRAFLSDLRGSA